MRLHVYIHATQAVENMLDLPSLVMEKIAGRTIVCNLIMNLQESKKIDCIYLITSDKSCDDLLVDTIKQISNNETFIPIEIIRIPSNTPYAINEWNRFLPSDLLYKDPHYGCYSAECLLEHVKKHPCDLALICTADDVPLLEADTVDNLLESHCKKGVSFGCGERHERNILLVPIEELSAKLVSCQYQRQNKLKEESLRVQEVSAKLLTVNPALEQSKWLEDKIRCIERYYSRPIHCKEILAKIYNSKPFAVCSTKTQDYQFYPVHSQAQLRKIKVFHKAYDHLNINTNSSDLDQFVYPSVVEIETTSRCNLSCTDCPQTILSRPKQDMDKKVYFSIIDRIQDMVPLVVLSGYGEPTLHPDILEFVTYAKQHQIPRVCMETNGSQLSKSFIEQLIEAQLDILVINVDAIDSFSDTKEPFGSESIIEKVQSIKLAKGSATPYLVIQVVNRLSRQQAIDYYYNRWEYIADAISIQPFNSFCESFDNKEFIDMIPPQTGGLCQKTYNSLFILANGNPVVCKQRFDYVNKDHNEDIIHFWYKHLVKGGCYDFCKQCSEKELKDLFISNISSAVLSYKLNATLRTRLIDKKINEADAFINKGQHNEALNAWEQVLKVYPDNKFIHNKITNLEKQLL